MPYDIGHAPCLADNRLSFGICMPDIRRRACLGDMVLGVSGARILRGRLIHAFAVSAILGPEYYSAAQYAHRCDCLYAPGPDGRPVHKGAQFSKHHLTEEHRQTDVGGNWQNARVLLAEAEAFRYFGKTGTAEAFAAYPGLSAALPRLRRMRWRLTLREKPALYREASALFAELIERFPPGVNGPPSEG
jgi:hypothetical protein